MTARVPGIDARLTRQVVAFVQALRALDLKKLPSISETLDWARAIVLLHGAQIDRALVRDTLNVLLKFEADIDHAESQMTDLLRAAEAATEPPDGDSPAGGFHPRPARRRGAGIGRRNLGRPPRGRLAGLSGPRGDQGRPGRHPGQKRR